MTEEKIQILILDDDENLRKILRFELARMGYDVLETSSATQALKAIEDQEIPVALFDLQMPDIDGIELLRRVKERNVPTSIIILTGFASVSKAVEAMKAGAFDFLTKPVNTAELSICIEKAYDQWNLVAENRRLRMQIRHQAQANWIVSKHPLMEELQTLIDQYALSDLPVLIQGESGAGKELVARAIHVRSRAPEGPFVALNCGAIPDQMLESELFGYEKGAFTGAERRKQGLLEVAHKGTLLLDEISEMDTNLQVKILRALETGSFFRIGGTKEISVDVRFLSATNRNLKEEVEKETFRLDLFYRLSVLTLTVPPLRERAEDIPLLIDFFAALHSLKITKKFSPEALQLMMNYSWPGNVRELKNVVQRVLLISRHDHIEPEDLPSDLQNAPTIALQTLQDVEREHIMKIMNQVGGKRAEAAKILGIDPKTLYRKLQQYGESMS